jgi:predicted Fe-Mo cluster-binding NifX family protein
MDERFGRARYILIVNTDTEEVQVIDNNDNLNAVQGAGIQSAQKMADHDVEWVITGHVGPKAFQALTKVKIKIGSGTQKTCRDALIHWKNGGYEPLTEADVNSHWG